MRLLSHSSFSCWGLSPQEPRNPRVRLRQLPKLRLPRRKRSLKLRPSPKTRLLSRRPRRLRLRPSPKTRLLSRRPSKLRLPQGRLSLQNVLQGRRRRLRQARRQPQRRRRQPHLSLRLRWNTVPGWMSAGTVRLIL